MDIDIRDAFFEKIYDIATKDKEMINKSWMPIKTAKRSFCRLITCQLFVQLFCKTLLKLFCQLANLFLINFITRTKYQLFIDFSVYSNDGPVSLKLTQYTSLTQIPAVFNCLNLILITSPLGRTNSISSNFLS